MKVRYHRSTFKLRKHILFDIIPFNRNVPFFIGRKRLSISTVVGDMIHMSNNGLKKPSNLIKQSLNEINKTGM